MRDVAEIDDRSIESRCHGIKIYRPQNFHLAEFLVASRSRHPTHHDEGLCPRGARRCHRRAAQLPGAPDQPRQPGETEAHHLFSFAGKRPLFSRGSLVVGRMERWAWLCTAGQAFGRRIDLPGFACTSCPKPLRGQPAHPDLPAARTVWRPFSFSSSHPNSDLILLVGGARTGTGGVGGTHPRVGHSAHTPYAANTKNADCGTDSPNADCPRTTNYWSSQFFPP